LKANFRPIPDRQIFLKKDTSVLDIEAGESPTTKIAKAERVSWPTVDRAIQKYNVKLPKKIKSKN
jgi:hypothetical protein